MRRPNLFIAGAPKCGTTAWYEYLRTHPDIFFPGIKEPNFFSADFPSTEGVSRRLEDYLALFEHSGSAKIVGEATPNYLFSKVAARNIRAFNPDAKIIVFLRDQPDFLKSAHSHLLYRGIEYVRDFEEAWRLSLAGPRKGNKGRGQDDARLDYPNRGRFHERLESFFAEFPAEQIRVFHFDDWSRNPRATYLEILNFLKLEDDGRVEFPAINEAKHHRTGFVVDFVRSPPPMVKVGVDLLKRVTGRPGLGLANLLFKLDTRKGTASRLSPELRREIEEFFAADNALLEPRICRPRTGNAPRENR